MFAILDSMSTGQFFVLPMIAVGAAFLVLADPVSKAVRKQRLRNAERARARLRARRAAALKRFADGR